MNGTGDKKDYDIWYVEKHGNGWTKPINAGNSINTGSAEYYVSFAKNGTIYFSSNAEAPEDNRYNFDIYSSAREKRGFLKPSRLSDSINSKLTKQMFLLHLMNHTLFSAETFLRVMEKVIYISVSESRMAHGLRLRIWEKRSILQIMNYARSFQRMANISSIQVIKTFTG